jgi:hypothetical protein
VLGGKNAVLTAFLQHRTVRGQGKM